MTSMVEAIDVTGLGDVTDFSIIIIDVVLPQDFNEVDATDLPDVVTMTGDVQVVVSLEGPPGHTPTQEEIDTLFADYISQHALTQAIERSFSTASDTWDWEHNLGYTPSVITLASDRSQIVGRISYNDGVHTTVEFYHPVAGIMALS